MHINLHMCVFFCIFAPNLGNPVFRIDRKQITNNHLTEKIV